MKKGKNYFGYFLILICITIFTVFKYIWSLNEQNKVLSANINQITKRIGVLESDKTMEKIVVLKAENAALKKQIGDLASRCPKLKVKPDIKAQKKKEKTVTGNRGFLIKR